MAKTPGKVIASRLENELANLLWSMGYAVVRGPSSGSGVRRRYQPDIVAIKNGVVLVIEVKKAREGKTVYIPERQVRGLKEFASRAKGLALIAVRIAGLGWRIHRLEDLDYTRNGNARIASPESGLKIEVFDELLFPKSRRITEWTG
ncbi:MAG: Holliday junction resolvase [Desulfurococcales archaeon]|nr:Holliday junction resolvase [Desulfurococcales archaeon]MCE4626493.1 Holliday junction resolvase [Desulfurococcales archaeon]